MRPFSKMNPMPAAPDQNAQAVQAAVDAFVRRHFHLGATLRLHRSALGWDLLRAPINVALAPIFLLMALVALVARLFKLRRFSAWLMARRVLLRTSVARKIEADIAADLLQAAPLTARSQALIDDYTSVRSAVAEITTSLIVLTTGWLLFGTATPGIASLAPAVSGYVGHATAVTNFSLGSTLGGAWYGVFPVALPVWFVIAIGAGLAMSASVVTTFAGIIADPVQAHLGIHRRRLIRLLGKIALIEGGSPGLAPEHILARVADLMDAGISLLRVFRS
jgi:hypothetical protein